VVSRREPQEPGKAVDLGGEARARVAEHAQLEPTPKFAEYLLRARIAAWVVFGFRHYIEQRPNKHPENTSAGTSA
jgi:Flp pilus assembly protein CpaB